MGVANHFVYLGLSVVFTIYVGQTLYQNGRAFLLECFGDEGTAASVNRLFLVGFYLMNMAFVCIILRYGETGATFERSLELISSRVGFVALTMGGMHFNNLFWCELFRQRRRRAVSGVVAAIRR